MLTRFMREKLLVRTKSPADGRSQLLSLTEEGRTVFHRLADAATAQLETLLAPLEPADRNQLVCHMEFIQALLSDRKKGSATIRTRRPGDLGYIAYRHAILYEKEYGLAGVFERYVIESLLKYAAGDQPGEVWVAEFGDQIVGFIGIVGIDPETAQLRWFLIEPDFRGTGLGNRLMAAAMEYCRQQGFHRIFLCTFAGLDAAQHLYRKHGFAPIERVPNDAWKQGLVEEQWEVSL
jgi:GNAT superfamily N-acetyltransferase